MGLTVRDLVQALEAIAPARLAASWDNVGLLVGDPSSPVTRALLTVDCTRAVVDEAAREACEAVVAYHPPIFAAQKRFVAGSVAYHAARAGLAVVSPHTALDAADGGTNDVLADAVGMRARTPLQRAPEAASEHKLVTFVPAEHVEAVSRALFAAGAGRIGKYSACSFRMAGTGTFFGEEGASPAVGAAGVLEQVPELRLEMVVPVARTAAVVDALRRAHPYEVSPATRAHGGAQFFLTGEVRHHDALRALDAGLAVVCVRHSTSERVALGALERSLAGRLPGVTLLVSREDREPFEFA
jgi:dinuclear metal center YbgI/SA1388 family protein